MGSVLRSPNTDLIFRSATRFMTKFFKNGWGDPEVYRQLANLQKKFVLNKQNLTQNVYKDFERTTVTMRKGKSTDPDVDVYRGEFISPLNKYMPNGLPSESERAHFQMILPKKWKSSTYKPICVHLAGTGDHHFWRRRHFMALPLAKENNIGSIILENPFYGYRKPKRQVRSCVNHVSDIFVMGAALLMEVVTLFLWLQRNDYGPFGITGVSMGGHMATISSSGWFEPIALVPCLSWSSAAPAFTEGVLSRVVDWDILEKQLAEDKRYEHILRNDMEFQQLLESHYVNPNDNQPNQQPVQTSKVNIEESGKYNQVYEKFTSLLSNLQLSSYMDLRGKKIGPYALEVDLWKQIESFPKHLYHSTANKFNLDYLRELSWVYELKGSTPSKETVAFMTGVMDQATHLSHYNTPHEDSVITYVVAEHDRYIPHECYQVTPQDIWKQTEVRSLNCGHIIGALQHQQDFRSAIKDSFDKLETKFYS